jgi:diguanylate cyclase (GGDEF)-like protein/PAS domain S-box-containing protein
MVKWHQALWQTTTYLGVAVLAIIWGGIYLLANEAHERAYQDAVRQGNNLTRVLEEYIRRVVQGTDGALLALRRAYLKDPQHFDVANWVARTQSHNDLTVNFGIAGPDGFVRRSSYGPLSSPIYLGDRANFQFQIEDRSDRLYISAPVVGRVSGKLAIEFTRRLSKPDGSFDGVVASSLDVLQLEKFFSSLAIGHGGVVSLVGSDGIVRARGGPDPDLHRLAGVSIIHSPLFAAVSHNAIGSYWNTAASSAKFDGTSRLICYRVVSGLPLIAVVGLAEKSIFKDANATLRNYVLAGTILSLIALIVMTLGVARQAQILSGKQSLEHTNLLLQTALTNMAHGVCMFDRDQRLVVCNVRYGEMYGLAPEQTKPGTTLQSILEARVAAGMSPQDGEQYVQARLTEVAEGSPYYVENELSDGRVYAVNHRPMRGGGWVAIHQDITEKKKVERALIESTEALKNSNARFTAALQNMSQGLCMVDSSQRILVANERYRQIYDLPEELTKPGTTLSELLAFRRKSGNYIGPSPAEHLAAQLNNPTDIEKLGNGRVVLTLRHAMGDGCWLTTHEDITERWRNETRVSFMAHHDALTGLANRAALIEKIEDACARHRRWGEVFTVLLLDLDRFKQVNDTFGHPAGDELLRQVAQRLKETLQETDVLARLGGDEFAIVQVNDIDQSDAAADLARRIIQVIGEPFSIDEHIVNIGASIGITLAPEHSIHADDLLKMADLALYHAKSLGRNRYSIFDPALGQAAVQKHVLENELRRALAQNEFEVHFQPIVDTRTLKMKGAEALIRWRHPEKGLIPPDHFIPLAEETGIIAQIGEWVLHAACSEATKWPSSVKVAVNLSAVQLRNSSLLDYVMCVLVETGLPPERLELEITETALIEHGAECLALLKKLKNLGISVALDDFGTGYSSLNQLTIFPFDKIKIDKSFTKGMTNRADCAAIISAVLALAHSLDIQTTAEGVETVDQLRILRLAKVSTVQGFLIQRPCTASELCFDTAFALGEVENAA